MGIDSVPRNGYSIKFRILTDCDFISGKSLQIIASGANACGEENSRSSYTQQVLIAGLPTSVNLYVINTTVPPALTTCSDPMLFAIKVINLGPSSVSSIEKLKVAIDDAFDYISGSLTGIHNGPTGMTNTVTAGIRYLDFDIEPNLAVNDSIVFTFGMEDIDPASLQCDTMPVETNTLLVAKVYCSTAPNDSCLIHSITSTQIQERPVLKDHTAFGKYQATSVPDGSAGEMVTITYAIRNTGYDTLNSDTLRVIFVHDANNNGIADETGADSLFYQLVPAAGTPAGDSVTATATFPVAADKVCRMLASVRLPENICTCGDIALAINNIRLLNAGPDVEVCMQTNIQIGLPPTTGYSYIWLPSLFLNSNTISNPVFNYNMLITQVDTIPYILNTTRIGNCISRDTTLVVVLPGAIANAGPDAVACKGYPLVISGSAAVNDSALSWSTSGTGAFDNPAILHPAYSASIQDETLGSVILTLTAMGLCGSDNDAMTLTFNDPATVSAGPDTSICASWNYTLTGTSASHYTSLLWNTSGDGTFSNPAILLPLYDPGPADSAAGSVILTLTATGLTSCPSITDSMTLWLPPPPVVTTSPPSQSICSGDTTAIFLTSSQPGTSFTWTAALTSGTVTGFGNGSGDTISQALTNPGTLPGVVTYTIIPANGGCTGLPFTFQVTVKPLPQITSLHSDTSFCSGGTTGFTLSSNIPGTIFSWTAWATSPSVSGFSGDTGNVISQTLTNSGHEIDSVYYSVTPELNGCTGADSLFIAVVFPVPEAIPDPLLQPVCSGDTALITITSPVAGTTFTWTATATSPDISGFSAGAGDTIRQQLLNSGNTPGSVIYIITPQASGCDGLQDTAMVTVNPIPAFISSFPVQTICPGDTFMIPMSANVEGTLFTWTATATSLFLTGYSSGSGDTIRQSILNTGYTTDTVIYTVTPSANGCAGADSIARVIVHPVPDVSNNPLNSQICSGTSPEITLQSNVAGTVFSWTATGSSPFITGYGPGSGPLISQVLTNTGVVPESVVYHIFPEANGCGGDTTDFTVTVVSVADVFFDPPGETICSGDTTGINLLSNVTGATFTWTAAGSSPNLSGYAAGSGALIGQLLINSGNTVESATYTVYPSAFGCPPGIPQDVTVMVNPIPAVTNTILQYHICSSTSIVIPLESSVAGSSFSWTAAGSSPNVSGYSSGTGNVINQFLVNTGFDNELVIYSVIPEANSCPGDTTAFETTVYPVPDIWCEPVTQTICSRDTCFIRLLSHVPGALFSWTASGSPGPSGDGPGSDSIIAQQLFNTALVPGSVTYTASPVANGCPGTSGQGTVIIEPLPAVSVPFCFDTVTLVTAAPVRLRGSVPVNGFWEGTGVSGDQFFPGMAGTGIHPVIYRYTNLYGCTDTAFRNIHVLADPGIICGDSITDPRDNRKYATILIGSHCWMAENLNYGTEIPSNIYQRDNCLPEKYRNPASSIQHPASVYQWDELMVYDDVEQTQGLCPPGWHVPSENEWNILFSNYISSGFAGNPLKYTGYSGFNALLNGARFYNKTWEFDATNPELNSTLFWSSTSHGPLKAWAHGMNMVLIDPEMTPSVSFYPSYRLNAFSVRCLRD
jgi:uncharacterized protein (TIGR02145 family)